jgi:hypothetical protein
MSPKNSGESEISFEEFYSQYPKKVDKKDAVNARYKLSNSDRQAVMKSLPNFVRCTQRIE